MAPMEEKLEEKLDHGVLQHRARMGVVWLLTRTVVLQFAVLGGNVVLARVLSPADFGIFAIVQFAVAFFMFFGDAGLGGALIQKQEPPTQRELSTVFNLQFGIAAVLVVLISVAASVIRLVWSELPDGIEWVFRALSVGLLLTVLRVIPSILMERQLLFGRLAILEVAGTLGFYGGAVIFALAGFGVWALVIGTLLQGVLSTTLALVMRPWKPSLVFDREALRPILRFGIPYQVKTIISFFNGAVTPLYAGAALGATSLGFIQFAQTTAYFPLKLVQIMGRVTFPLYSRLQDDPKAFAETLGRSIQICAFATFFFVGLFLGMGRQVIHVIFTDKWLPALPLLYIYASVISIGFISPVAAAALDASGRPQIIAKLAFGWTLLNWAVVLLTTPRWGMVGFAAGYSVHVVVGNVAVLILMLYLIPGVRVMRRVAVPMVGGVVVFGFGRWVGPYAMDVPSFIGAVVACFAIFALVLGLLDRKGIRDALAIVPRRSAEADGQAEQSEVQSSPSESDV
jgi:PST family polysaccharide transporter